MRYPKNKKEAQLLESEKIGWGVAKEIGELIYHYLIDIGAKHELPSEKMELVNYINEFHKKLTIRNVHCPDDIPFEIIYPAFMSAVLNEFVRLSSYQPQSAKSQLSAFKKWITKGGQMDKLYQRWYSKNPDARPKQLTEGGNGTVENWTDSVIIDQHKKIQELMGENINLLNTKGAKNYFGRIEHELLKRELIEHD